MTETKTVSEFYFLPKINKTHSVTLIPLKIFLKEWNTPFEKQVTRTEK